MQAVVTNQAVTDEELVLDFQQSGRVTVLDELVSRHIGAVRRLVYCSVRNDADADDVTQEVFLRAFRGLPGFRGRTRFSTWLYSITMNTTRAFLRRRTRSPIAANVELREDSVEGGRHPAAAALGREVDEQIRQGLESLSPKLRAAIVLTAIQGVSATAAAEIEGCAVATMYWRLHEARRQLKRRLAPYLTDTATPNQGS